MSSAYSTEPPTKGKVVLKTSMGDLEVELWPKEAPQACRNFVQLCMEGYYDNLIFHRVVKGFIVQGGDPTGTGFGGESVFGAPFPCELHSRLKFNRRGLLGTANTGNNDNKSQFFFTLDRADSLQGKHTLFGKIVGDTIFNLLAIGELEVEAENDRPLFPARILETEVIVNPFDDIIPRERELPAKISDSTRSSDVKKEDRPKKKPRKNVNLLSFEEEEEGGGESSSIVLKSKSIHDVVKDDPRLAKLAPPEEQDEITSMKSIKRPESMEVLDEPVRKELSQTKSGRQNTAIEPPVEVKPKQKLHNNDKPEIAPKPSAKPVSLIHQVRASYTKEGKAIQANRARKGTSFNADQRLAELESILGAQISDSKVDIGNEECSLHFVVNCQSCHASDPDKEEEDDLNDSSWMRNPLVFKKETGQDNASKSFNPTVDDYSFFDPLSSQEISNPPTSSRSMASSSDFWRDKAVATAHVSKDSRPPKKHRK